MFGLQCQRNYGPVAGIQISVEELFLWLTEVTQQHGPTSKQHLTDLEFHDVYTDRRPLPLVPEGKQTPREQRQKIPIAPDVLC